MEVNWTGGVSAPESGLQAPHPPQLWLPSLSHTCQCSAWGLSPACGVCMSEPFLLTTATGEPERDSHSSSTGRPRLREIALWRYCFLAHAAISCPDWESRNGLAYALLKEVGGIMIGSRQQAALESSTKCKACRGGGWLTVLGMT